MNPDTLARINYCPEHGDLLNLPGSGRDTRSIRCQEAHTIAEIRALIPESPTGARIVEPEAALERYLQGISPATTDDANDLAVALRSILDSIKCAREASVEEWSTAMDAERAHQIAKGYDEALARIDAVRAEQFQFPGSRVRVHRHGGYVRIMGDYEIALDAALVSARAVIVRLMSEPTVDEKARAEIARVLEREENWFDVGSGFEFSPERGADAILASPVWRNRGRGSITEEQRDAVADFIWNEMVGAAKSTVRKVMAEAFESAGITSALGAGADQTERGL